MAGKKKRSAITRRVVKKKASTLTFRDSPAVPTVKEIEESITRGSFMALSAFKKGVKL